MITTLAECLMGTPISPWAGSFSLSAPLAGFLCASPEGAPNPVRPPTDSGDPEDCKTPQGEKPVRLVYEHNPKHGAVSRMQGGVEVARRPHGGQAEWQAILDASAPDGSRHRRGVEPDTGLSVTLRLHLEQELQCEIVKYYHGYVPGG